MRLYFHWWQSDYFFSAEEDGSSERKMRKNISDKKQNCSQISSKKFSSKRIQQRHEDKLQCGAKDSQLDRSLFGCKNCEESFVTLKKLQIHLDSKHLDIPPSFKCNDCQKSFKLVSTSLTSFSFWRLFHKARLIFNWKKVYKRPSFLEKVVIKIVLWNWL